MNTQLLTTALIRLCLISVFLGLPLSAQYTPLAFAAKSSGVNVTEVGDNAVQATLLVERPITQVYDVIRQTEKVLAKDPTFESVVVTKRMGSNSELVKYRQKVSPFLPAYVYTSQVDYTPNKGTKFHRVSGSFKAMDGSCQLVATENPNQTKIVYTLKVALDVPLPQAIINHLLKHDLPRSLNLMKAAIYQQYPTTPIKVASGKK
jgi:Polyketide cyclase / dehydrase and lipid transport